MKDRFQRIREIRSLPSTALRIYFFAFIILTAMGALAAKLWNEQMIEGKKWKDKVGKEGEVTVRIPSVRGEIRDRNGWPLVENQPSYGVDFYLPEMVQGMKDTIKQRNQEKLQEAQREGKHFSKKELEEVLEKLPVRTVEVKRGEMMAKVEIPNVVDIIKNEVQPKLRDLGLLDDETHDGRKLSLDFNAPLLEKHFFAKEHVPFSYLDGVTIDTVAKIYENDIGLTGLEPCVRPTRRYIYGAFACHLLGYVGNTKNEDDEADYYAVNEKGEYIVNQKGEKRPRFDYYKSDIVGHGNVEKHCDRWLRGKPGTRYLERTAKGKTGAEIRRVDPTPGNNVYLTIDARIQMIAENALRASGVGRAAAVVVDPNNGDILAMACVPNYDPNTFAEKLKEMDDDQTDPLLPRCIQGYPPGSTYKQVTALALLRAGVPPGRPYFCNGFVTYGGRPMKCTGSHGPCDLSRGIMKSCNCYFYQASNAMGSSAKDGFMQIETIGTALGLGTRSALQLDSEDPGTLPGPRMFAATGKLTEMDSGGQLANTSIGQGKVEVSPLQMAMITATVANGGKSYYPRLISRVVDTDQNDVRDENGNLFFPVEPKLRADLTEMGLKPSDIEIVRRGMWKVVNDPGGTGKSAKIKGIEVAGKTGTAQAYRRVRERDANGEWKDVKDEKGEYKKEKDYHVWFTEFAPYKDPKYAICVMVESGGGDARGGTVAAPIATKIMRESLALIALDKTEQADAKFAPTVLQPVAGNFTPIKTVALADDGSMSKVVADAFKDVKPGTPAADDDERMDHDDDAPVIRRKRTEANVAAKKAADARGTLQPSAKPTRQPTWFERTFMGKKPAAPR